MHSKVEGDGPCEIPVRLRSGLVSIAMLISSGILVFHYSLWGLIHHCALLYAYVLRRARRVSKTGVEAQLRSFRVICSGMWGYILHLLGFFIFSL